MATMKMMSAGGRRFTFKDNPHFSDWRVNVRPVDGIYAKQTREQSLNASSWQKPGLLYSTH